MDTAALFTHIEDCANAGVVTGDDWLAWVCDDPDMFDPTTPAHVSKPGHAFFEADWVPTDMAGNEPIDGIYEFFVRRVSNSEPQMVNIGIFYGKGRIGRTWVSVWIDPDELALRMIEA